MIRITTTEPYYEVSKVVSSQLANIQIGKNGVSEYDIAGALTVYSPQILTVTIRQLFPYLTMLSNSTLISNETLIKNE